MPNPVNDDSITLWQPDAATTDTNLPQGSSSMAPGGPTELAGELRSIKSVCREESINKAWERWQNLYGTLAFIDATHFSLTGDQRTAAGGGTGTPVGPVEIGRRVKCTVAAGFLYGTITGVTFALGLTTVTVAMDSGSLDATLSEVAFGTETLGNSALPSGVLTPLYGVATGTDTYAVAIGIAAYTTGQEYRVRFTNANTGPATLNIDGLGAKSIVKGGATALSAGDLPAGAVAELVYDGTNLQLIGSASGSIVPMGSSGFGATAIGTASIQVGSVGTPASTVETTLFSYVLPANALDTNGQYLEVEAWGQFANDSNQKTVRLKFGTSVIATFQWPSGSGPSDVKGWFMKGFVIRTGAATQQASGIAWLANSTSAITVNAFTVPTISPTETLSGGVTVAVTGQNGSAVANDIRAFGFRVLYCS